MNKPAESIEVVDAIVQTMYEWQEGWRFCDEEMVDYPHLVVSDDCACQITVDMNSPLFGCNCICHKKTKELATRIAKALEALYNQRMEKTVRATNISQIENWRDWLKDNPDEAWLVEEMDSAIKSLKDETLTDENGVFREFTRAGINKKEEQ